MIAVGTVDIASPPDAVLAVLFDVERWPQWTKTMLRIERLDAGPFCVGSRAHVSQPKLRPALWTVTELTPGRGFSWVSKGLGIAMRAGHSVELTANGSRVTLTFEVAGWLAGVVRVFYGTLIEAYVAAEARSLKSYCEGLGPA